MMSSGSSITSLWWLIHKDLVRELRTFRILPGMLLLGVVLVALLALQIDLPAHDEGPIMGGLLWVAILFAGTLLVEPLFATERANGCWETLLHYPAAPAVLFLAKMTVCFVSMTILELLIIPLFTALTDVPLLSRPAAMIVIAGLSNIGFAAIGTMAGAITADVRNRSGLIAVLLFPLLMPVVLASASATKLMLADEMDQAWWRWIQLLGVFATVFIIFGAMIFEFIIEES
jgi:heme exporter protein B